MIGASKLTKKLSWMIPLYSRKGTLLKRCQLVWKKTKNKSLINGLNKCFLVLCSIGTRMLSKYITRQTIICPGMWILKHVSIKQLVLRVIILINWIVQPIEKLILYLISILTKRTSNLLHVSRSHLKYNYPFKQRGNPIPPCSSRFNCNRYYKHLTKPSMRPKPNIKSDLKSKA